MAKILWIGVGKMGLPISTNLLRAGHEVAVHDSVRENMEAAAAAGAVMAEDARAAAAAAEFVFTTLPNPEVLVEVVAGANGVAAALDAGKILIDMSTVSAASSRLCAEAVAPTGALYLRSPVNGSTVFAQEAKLTVIASGPRPAYDRALPLFEKISQRRFYVGDGEEARFLKLAINLQVATTLQMFAEAAAICEKAGIDWNMMLDVFAGSAIASPQLLFKIPPLRERDFTPAFTTRLMAKDVRLALDAARELGVFAPATAVVEQMLEAGIARGDAEKDFSSVLETIEAMSGLK